MALLRISAGLVALFAYASGQAQTTVEGGFEHGGIDRTYSYHVPASYTPGVALPLVIGLHGLGSSGADFAEYRDFRPIADTANFIMAHPDGSTLLGIRFWNYGNVLGSNVDDVGFLEALIDTIASHYTVDPQRIYAVGMSNGGFMVYALACGSDRFAAVGAVTGSMSVDMHASCTPEQPTPVIHVHGTNDGTNPYEGTSTMIGIEELVAFWVAQNGCGPTPAITTVPDTDPSDGATAEHQVYTGGTNGHTVEHFKVIGGGHAWPGSPYPGSSGNTCMDFDARTEIWRFFRQHARGVVTSVEGPMADGPDLWPNPTDGIVHLRADRGTTLSILDLQGRVVAELRSASASTLDLGHLPPGTYVAVITGTGAARVRKLVVH